VQSLTTAVQDEKVVKAMYNTWEEFSAQYDKKQTQTVNKADKLSKFVVYASEDGGIGSNVTAGKLIDF
jgi:hypothetical protein